MGGHQLQGQHYLHRNSQYCLLCPQFPVCSQLCPVFPLCFIFPCFLSVFPVCSLLFTRFPVPIVLSMFRVCPLCDPHCSLCTFPVCMYPVCSLCSQCVPSKAFLKENSVLSVLPLWYLLFVMFPVCTPFSPIVLSMFRVCSRLCPVFPLWSPLFPVFPIDPSVADVFPLVPHVCRYCSQCVPHHWKMVVNKSPIISPGEERQRHRISPDMCMWL